MRSIDLNADVGEDCGHDADLFKIVTSANICCGVHAGSLQVLSATLDAARTVGVRAGAHPSYADRANFGRISMPLTAEVRRAIDDQVGDFQDVSGMTPAYIKAHGALYNDAYRSKEVADFLTNLGQWYQCPVMGQPSSALHVACIARGVPFIREVFADRAYSPDGSLVPRTVDGAVLHDSDLIAARMVGLVTTGQVETIGGSMLTLGADSICLHGDNPAAAGIAHTVRAALTSAGITVTNGNAHQPA